MLPSILFALSAAFVFGLNLHIQNKGLDDTDELTGTFLSVASMAVVFWLLSPAFVDYGWFLNGAVLFFVATGVFVPALGQRLQISSIRRVGPAISSAINGFMPVFSVLPAVLILGETFGLQASIGLAIMIGGVLLTTLSKGRIKRSWPLWALLIPLTGAAVRGFAPVINKSGFAEINSPYFAALVQSTVSTLILGLLLLARGRPAKAPVRRTGYRWFAASGLLNGFGILCVNSAVSLGDVTVVAPLLMINPIFALGFSVFVFKREVITANHLVLIAAIVTGSLLIVMR